MRYKSLILVILVAFPTALFPQAAIDVSLSKQVLPDTARFYGSRVLTFARPTSSSLITPARWTDVETAAIIDNPRLQPVTIVRYKDEQGAIEYAVASDGSATYDSALVLHFHNSENREIADVSITIRSKDDADKTYRSLACQIVLSAGRVIARIAECREGMLRIGDHSYAVRFYVPSINDPFYSLSSETACLIDMNGDDDYSWGWHLADSGGTIIPSEQVALTNPFSINGKRLKAAAIDSAGTRFTCEEHYGDTAAVVGFKAPNFSFTDISGTPRSLSVMHGKIILVTFWSSHCPYCEKIRPELNALIQRCDSTQFQSIAAAVESNPKTIAAFLHDKPYDGIIMPYDSSFWGTYNRRMSTPVYYLIDRDGSIILSGSGASLFTIVERLTTKLLQNN